ncbi:MAG TPA: hypothetical protein VKS21_07550 [Spirochaetota bacterium]|nr:hypothetical protein [Spirochaetota bacterium]
MKINIILIILLLSFSNLVSGTVLFNKKFNHSELEMELGLYYLPLGYIIYLSDEEIPRVDPDSEKGVYTYLLRRFFQPRYLVVEVSTYPLPVTGWALQRFAPAFYNRARIKDINLIESLTAVFYEPWAAALFLGNLAKFKPKHGRNTAGKAYIGLLVCYGNYYLKANQAVADHWLEIEYKLKGELEQEIKTLAWSFRLGTRIHFNKNIKDTLYLSFFRDRTDFNDKRFSLIRNTYYELRWDTAFKKKKHKTAFHLIRQTVIIGKKFPVELKKRDKKIAFAISTGIVWEPYPAYLGSLARGLTRHDITFIFQPKVEF